MPNNQYDYADFIELRLVINLYLLSKKLRVKYNKPEELFGVVNGAFHQAIAE